MKRRLICCSFASKEGYNGSANAGKNIDAVDIYIKNACVCCFSAKKYNPTCDVAFIHNLSEVPEQYDKFFKKHNILSIYVPYEKYTFPSTYKWSLAFYKLCVLDYLAHQEKYDAITMVDTDTIIIDSLESMWEVSETRLMLYNVQHPNDLEAYQERLKEYRRLYSANVFPSVWGGEFISASRIILREFMEECKKVYDKIIENNFETQFGDEFITFCAAENYKAKISDAAPYIRRYWTVNIYFQVFTDHALKLKIMHIPNEKNSGFLRIYNYILKKGDLPQKDVIFKIMGCPKVKRPIYIRNIMYQGCRKAGRIVEKIFRSGT